MKSQLYIGFRKIFFQTMNTLLDNLIFIWLLLVPDKN